jgi:hypothetical protein
VVSPVAVSGSAAFAHHHGGGFGARNQHMAVSAHEAPRCGDFDDCGGIPPARRLGHGNGRHARFLGDF